MTEIPKSYGEQGAQKLTEVKKRVNFFHELQAREIDAGRNPRIYIDLRESPGAILRRHAAIEQQHIERDIAFRESVGELARDLGNSETPTTQ